MASVESPPDAAPVVELQRPDVVLVACQGPGGLAPDVLRAVLALADLDSRDELS